MSNRFDRPARHAHIRGVEISSTPVPWRHVRACIEAEAAADHAALLAGMAAAVRECVCYADGTPLDPDDLDCEIIAELFAFSTGRNANFTPTVSPATPAAEAVTTEQEQETLPPTWSASTRARR